MLQSVFRMCASIFQYTRVSATSLCTILYNIPEVVIAGNILRHKGISVAHAIWFVCSKITNDLFLSRFIIGELAKLHDQQINYLT